MVGVGFCGLEIFLRNLLGADADIPPQDVCVRAVETGSRFPQAAAGFKFDNSKKLVVGADADIPPQDICARAVETESRFPQAAAGFKPDNA